MNRYWDAAVSILGVTYVCQNASKLIHENIAHWYPHVADLINERCLENFNIVAYYPATPAGDVVFENLQDMMEQMLEKTITFQNEFMAVRNIAMDNNDLLVVVVLFSAMNVVCNYKVKKISDNLTGFYMEFFY